MRTLAQGSDLDIEATGQKAIAETFQSRLAQLRRINNERSACVHGSTLAV
jgi:hypothetical protein